MDKGVPCEGIHMGLIPSSHPKIKYMSRNKISNYNAESEKGKGIRPPHPPKSRQARENWNNNNIKAEKDKIAV